MSVLVELILLGPLTGRAEAAFPSAAHDNPACAPANPHAFSALANGQWRGVLAFDGAPARFTIEVGARTAQVQFAGRAVEVIAPRQIGARMSVALSSSDSEWFEGSVHGDTFSGHYIVAGDDDMPALSVPFRATREPSADEHFALAPALAGEWTVQLRRNGVTVRNVTALIGQGREKTYVLWREPDGTRRALFGAAHRTRLALGELAGGAALLEARLDPGTGVLSGRFADASGTFTFTAHRRLTTKLINLAGLD